MASSVVIAAGLAFVFRRLQKGSVLAAARPVVKRICIAFVVLALCFASGELVAAAGKTAAPAASKLRPDKRAPAATPQAPAKKRGRLAGLLKVRRKPNAAAPKKKAAKVERASAPTAAAKPTKEHGTLRLLTLEAPRLTFRAIKSHPRLFARGIVLDGPKHAYRSIAKHKKAFFGGMAAVATAGGLSHAFDINLEPAVLAISITLLAIQARDAVRYIHRQGLSGGDAARVLGERLAFPMILVNSSTVAGFAVSGGEHVAAAGQAVMTKAATGAAANGLIGGDSPAIMATILAGKSEKH